MPEVPFFRLSNKNLTVSQKARFVMAVQDGLTRGISIAETTKRYGLNKNAYAIYAKQIREGTCDPKPGSGRPQVLSEADKELLWTSTMSIEARSHSRRWRGSSARENSRSRKPRCTVSTNAMAGVPCELGPAPYPSLDVATVRTSAPADSS